MAGEHIDKNLQTFFDKFNPDSQQDIKIKIGAMGGRYFSNWRG